MLFIPTKHPLNWFQYDVAGSIELLEVYVSDIERQVENGITGFKKNTKEIVLEPNHIEEDARIVKTITAWTMRHGTFNLYSWNTTRVCSVAQLS